MWLTVFLSIYVIGMVVCGLIFLKTNKNSKLSPVEIFLIIYFILISWIGVFSLLCGVLAGFNEIEDEEDIENEQ